MSAIVAAGAGAKVLKHGNRAASSACGAADVLEELGIPLDLTAAQVAAVGELAGITFCFAPAFHPALRHAAVPRRELGVPTTFNFLGPLANPGNPSAQAVGVGDGRIAGLMAGVLARRGIDALVFHGDDGLDELTTMTTSQVWTVGRGVVEGPETLDPRELGIAPVPTEALRGGGRDVQREGRAGAAGWRAGAGARRRTAERRVRRWRRMRGTPGRWSRGFARGWIGRPRRSTRARRRTCWTAGSLLASRFVRSTS